MRFVLRFYQLFLSPALHVLTGGSGCRFDPTCSRYAVTAFERFGFFRGGVLTVRRIARCHPFSRSSFHDPVPDQFLALSKPCDKCRQPEEISRWTVRHS